MIHLQDLFDKITELSKIFAFDGVLTLYYPKIIPYFLLYRDQEYFAYKVIESVMDGICSRVYGSFDNNLDLSIELLKIKAKIPQKQEKKSLLDFIQKGSEKGDVSV